MGNTLSTSSDVLDSLDLTDTCGLDEVQNIGNDLLTRTLITKDTPESHHGAYGLLIHLPPSQDGTSFSELFQPKNLLYNR